ncbi:unnamed protein product [Haemonchus placei]|uniref:Secreted protein n=1 Tax=Haemonchus placei TaxID=6290 RepID=A0A0N4WZV7_HAEPC|nr:unnamed protein product [Haemonchus placei]
MPSAESPSVPAVSTSSPTPRLQRLPMLVIGISATTLAVADAGHRHQRHDISRADFSSRQRQFLPPTSSQLSASTRSGDWVKIIPRR